MKLNPIATIETPFTQKFGIPRQGNLATGIKGTIHFEPDYCNPDYLRGIHQFSHLWLTFSFHLHLDKDPCPLVRPPRLGGNEKIGVFASRSSFRPNALGLSLVKNRDLLFDQGKLKLMVEDVDLLNGTPIFDIKPYIPYSDTANAAKAGYATEPPAADIAVEFTAESNKQAVYAQGHYPDLIRTITIMLASDPRPAYKKERNDSKQYTMKVYDLDVTWTIEHDRALVTQIVQC